MYYYRARYYDPVLKRFISEDPIGIRGGLNLAAYVRGNPISFVDPHGLLNLVIGAGAAAAGGIAGTPASGQFDIESGGYFNFESGEIGAYQTTGGPSGGEVGGANGPYGGAFAGAGATIGLVKGSAENVGGTFQNLNIQIPGTPVGIVIYYDPNNQFQGAGITIGPGGGAGLTRTNTRLFPRNRSAAGGQVCP